MTHDLLKNVIEGLEARVDQVVITDLKDNTFFALIHLERGGQRYVIDARPSDAMALALRTAAPIFVERQVLDKSEGSGEPGESDHAERLRRWLETVDPEELGKYEM
jgi:bifunctional DNase/RNase